MSERSAIEWTDATWTPLRARNLATGKVGWHCELASPGCQNCYSQRQNRWTGTGLPFVRRSRDEVEVFLDEKILTAPLGWREPKKIFVCANTDLFGEWVPDEWIDRVFAVMALAPQHAFQVLTKRARRMREWFERTASGADRETVVYESEPGFSEKGGRVFWPGWPLPNVWLGVSAEDQQRLDARAWELLAAPAAVRFVSAEPLIGPIDFDGDVYTGNGYLRGWHTEPAHGRHDANGLCADCPQPVQVQNPKLDWVIVGGESGPGARPMDIAWARDIMRQCREAGVACFVKQLGVKPHWPQAPEECQIDWLRLKDRKGGDPSEWPEDLRVREFPKEVRP
jgi:protein gp37